MEHGLRSWSVTNAILLLGAAFLLSYVLRLLYNVYLHPLAKFPGPKLAAASRWYDFYFDVLKAPGGQYMYEINRMHEQYGPIVRIGPNEVHINDPDFREVLYAIGPKRNKVKYMVDIFGTNKAVFGTESHELHRSRRAVLTPYFSRRTVQKLEGLIREKTNILARSLSEHHRTGEIVNVRHAVTALTIDIVTEYSFGKCAHALSSPNFSPHWEAMVAGISEYVPLARHFPGVVTIAQSLPLSVIRLVNPLMAAFSEFEQDCRRQVTALCTAYARGTLAETKPAGPAGVSTVFHEILESDCPEAEKNVDRLTQEAYSVIGAAAETTGNVATNIIFHLARDGALLERLRGELRATMKGGAGEEEVSWKALEAVPLLTAVIKEGLRITAPVCSRLPLIAFTPLLYQTWHIPPGTFIGTSPIDALHHPAIFPSPLSFSPDRWLTATPAQLAEMENAFVPFGRGSRMCIGFSLAYANLYHLIAMMTRFEFETVDTVRERDIDVARDYFVSKPAVGSRGVKVRIVREW